MQKTGLRLLSYTPTLLRSSKASNIPAPTASIPDVGTFLKTIGRGCEEYSEPYENKWEELFKLNGQDLKQKGVPVQQRRYILQQVERLRHGIEVKEIKKGTKMFFGGERHRKERIAKWKAEQRKK